MRNIISGLLLLVSFGSCSESDPDLYTGQKVEYQLNKASEYEYTGAAYNQRIN